MRSRVVTLVLPLALGACVSRVIVDDLAADAAPDSEGVETGLDPGTTSIPTLPDTGDPPVPAPTFETDIQPILSEFCVMDCHSAGGEWALLSMEPGVAYGALVDEPSVQAPLDLIEPGSPDDSYLFQKLMGTQAAAGGGGLDMPKARPGEPAEPLPPEDIALIEAWILADAPP